MNLKNCVKGSEKKPYNPHQIRSRPFRCLILPIFGVFLFILFWFILCPLLFVYLLQLKPKWPKIWQFIYWLLALIVFVILLLLLVYLWRRRSKHKNEILGRKESDFLLNNIKNECKKNSCSVTLYTIQKSQEPAERSPPTEKIRNRPSNLSISQVTTVELHNSTSSPLSPRELFFWDLIQSANKSSNSVSYNFIENEKKFCSLDNFSVSSPKRIKSAEVTRRSRASADYFIANVPDRKSLTAEAFLFVDGGETERCLQIRNNVEVDDDVFVN